MKGNLILVDELDNIIGTGEKLEIHKKGLLHRAFSIFIYDWYTQKMLIQKRATNKYHSGGLWSNACCSHPRNGVNLELCLHERLMQELGYNVHFHIVNSDNTHLLTPQDDEIYYAGSFRYHAKFHGLSENEIDHVFLYSPCHSNFTQLKPNKSEVEDIKWISISELNDMLKNKPDLFTAWFRTAFEYACKILEKQSYNKEKFIG